MVEPIRRGVLAFVSQRTLVAAVAAAAITLLASGAIESSSGPKPFGLPFASPPGPGTWFVSQSYGNTVFAYFERNSIYRAGQGLHMGLDLAAACGTPVVAIGDGTVLSVDGRGVACRTTS